MEDFYYLRDLTVDDWSNFHEMDKLIFNDETMMEETFRSSIVGINSLIIVAIDKETKKFIGYLLIRIHGNEGHIARIGVLPEFQRKGLGSILLEKSIHHLKKGNCTNYFLYVLEDNIPAISLYKKYGFNEETISHQFKVPYTKLPNNPRGKCRHIDWGEIQLISLRFNQNPFRIQQFFGNENQHVLTYEVMGQQIGFCRFSPNFPGAMPFVLKDVTYLFDFIAHLKELITNNEFNYVRITLDGQEKLVQKMTDEKIPLNYKLLKMRKVEDE
ncbi:MAG: GNAT family N-acetyltransferase [Candidatus Heimdallarchaeota archaeon]|nr:GNAT family N-acetyltransferase [Candidatus Heimdallarchaeota archaeon]